MNKQTLESLLLLEQSGELTPQQERELATLLASSDEAKQTRAELERLVSLAREPDSTPTPGYSMQNILDAAQPTSPAPQAIAWPKRPLFALAATLLLAAGLWVAFDKQGLDGPSQQIQSTEPALAWNDDFDDSIDQLNDLIASVDDEWKMDDLDQVAAELLELEGMTI